MRTDSAQGDDTTLVRRGLQLEYITLGWNVVGSAVIIAAAIEAGSVALAGFGIDSLIEIFASMIVVWQLKGASPGRERTALRLISIAFFALAAYILIQSIYTLWSGARPAPSTAGLIWLAMTVAAMLLLSWGKLATGRRLNNQVLIAESRVTLVDSYLAAAVLVGVGLNALFGWWWADPVSGLVIVYYGLQESLEARRHAAGLSAIN